MTALTLQIKQKSAYGTWRFYIDGGTAEVAVHQLIGTERKTLHLNELRALKHLGVDLRCSDCEAPLGSCPHQP